MTRSVRWIGAVLAAGLLAAVLIGAAAATPQHEDAKLTASDAAAGDRFGYSVAISGDTAVIGSYFDDDAGSYSGSAYVFGPATPGNTPPTVGANQTAVTVGEGQAAANGGAVGDDDGDTVTLTASVGAVANNGDGTWAWSFVTSDGPAESQTVTISADDGNGGTASVDFDLGVANVAPTVGAVVVPAEPSA